ncbi:hypothetical protein Q5752_000932 [Cryptotrichosporon argae]
MGQVSSAFDPDGGAAVPANYTIPPFPSLYSPTFSNLYNNRGYFLYDAEAIWKFTFYWTLIMFGAAFLLCSLLASFNLFLSLSTRPSRPVVVARSAAAMPVRAASTAPSAGETMAGPASSCAGARWRSSQPLAAQPIDPGAPFHATAPAAAALPLPWRSKRRRPPLWLVGLIPLVMGGIAALVALISGTVVGFALAAIYSAGSFSMSTWVPFLWALIQVCVLIVSSYSTLTRIL